MNRPFRTPALAIALAAVLIIPSAASAKDKKKEDLNEERIALLEARVEQLQEFLAETLGFGVDDPNFVPKQLELVLPARITEKKFSAKDAAHGQYEDYLRVEVAYDTTPLLKPAVALKGTLEFADPFGEVRFTMPAHVNDRIQPGEELEHAGLRFKFNQFRDTHLWMNRTDPEEMVVHLRVSAVRYADGTDEEFRQ
ncbi:MAG: hypothetical protein HKN12_02515 [Gemmatimonadetes bacterium]|nr:hypothetical protein [Gemmatimonadota bacterium]